MTMINSVKEWLLTCPDIQADKFYYNFLKVENKSQSLQILTTDNQIYDIIGGEVGTFGMSIIDFRSLSDDPVVFNPENLDDYVSVENITNWIKEQEKLKNYPIVEGYIIDELRVSSNPSLAGIDQTNNVYLAKYTLSFEFDYIQLEKPLIFDQGTETPETPEPSTKIARGGIKV